MHEVAIRIFQQSLEADGREFEPLLRYQFSFIRLERVRHADPGILR